MSVFARQTSVGYLEPESSPSSRTQDTKRTGERKSVISSETYIPITLHVQFTNPFTSNQKENPSDKRLDTYHTHFHNRPRVRPITPFFPASAPASPFSTSPDPLVSILNPPLNLPSPSPPIPLPLPSLSLSLSLFSLAPAAVKRSGETNLTSPCLAPSAEGLRACRPKRELSKRVDDEDW